MPRRFRWPQGLVLAFALSLTPPVQAAVTIPTPLRRILYTQELIFVAKVESIFPDKPAVVLQVHEALKGKAPFRRMPVNLAGDDEGKRHKHPPQLLKRLAPEMPLIVFTEQRGKKYTAFGYSNGTWFQMIGHVGDDPAAVRWAFTHCEPYLRRTFKGTTAELKQVVIDGLAGKKDPPEPNMKEPPGLGPEIKPGDKPAPKGARATGGPLFAVIPTFVLIGPLALLATLFPAVFGGFQRRWLVLMSIVSLVSTLYVLHALFRGYIKDYWWGSTPALWAVMTLVALGGVAWSWRRYRAALSNGHADQLRPRRGDEVGLALFSLTGIGVVGYCYSRGVLFEPPWKELLAIWAIAWAGMLYALFLRWVAPGRPVPPAEGVMLTALVFACAGLGALALPRDSAQAFAGGGRDRVSVAWMFEARDRGHIVSSPLVAGNRVYVAAAHQAGFSKYGALYCLDRATGKQLWAFTDDDNMKQVFANPTLADGRLYIGEGFHEDRDCKLYCLDAATGKKLWDFPTTSHTESSPCVVTGRVYFGAGDDGLYCLDAVTGKEIWHFRGLHVDANPVVRAGRVYAGSGVGDVYNGTATFCLDADTGKEVWRVPVDLPAFGNPTVAGDLVFYGLGNGNFINSADKPAGALLCVKALTGRRVWRVDVPDAVHAKPVVKDEQVWFASRDRHVYCVDRREGKPIWKQDLGGPVVATPALTDGALYVVASSGRVCRLNPDDGEVRWAFDVAAKTRTKPLMVASPAVVTAGGQRWLFCGGGLDNSLTSAAVLYCLEDVE